MGFILSSVSAPCSGAIWGCELFFSLSVVCTVDFHLASSGGGGLILARVLVLPHRKLCVVFYF